MMAGLIAVPVNVVTGAAMFASAGARTTAAGSLMVIITVAEDAPAVLVAVMVYRAVVVAVSGVPVI